MNWFKKEIFKGDTVESLMDEILADPLVKVEMKLTPLGFRKTYINQHYNLYILIQSLPISQRDMNKICNNGVNFLKYKDFYVCLYRRKGENQVFAISEEIGLVEITEVIGMNSNDIQRVLGDLNDSSLKEFRRNNLIDNLL